MMQIIAHRGARSLAPENTLAAAYLACDLGADLWEADVQATRDGHLILFHDPTFDRCTNVKKVFPGRENDPVTSFTLEDVKRLDAGTFFCDTDPFGQIAQGCVTEKDLSGFTEESVPMLDAALALTRGRQWKINVELKNYSGGKPGKSVPQKTMMAIEKAGISSDQVVISSFYHSWLDWIRQNNPSINVQALVGKDGDNILDFQDFRFDTYNVNANLVSPEQIALLKEKKKKVNIFTVNDVNAFDAFAQMGVDGIITDFPQLFVGKESGYQTD